MDDLLREFLTETSESLDVVDVELVRFEQEPNNAKILDNIFRLVHTIKGTCGFLGLPRLEALAHAAETLMSKFRDGMPVTGDAVSVVLATIDRIKKLLDELEEQQHEPAGSDRDLIDELERMVLAAPATSAPAAVPATQPTAGTLTSSRAVRAYTPSGPRLTIARRGPISSNAAEAACGSRSPVAISASSVLPTTTVARESAWCAQCRASSPERQKAGR